MALFRQMMATGKGTSVAAPKPINFNFRPIQGLNGRRVYYSGSTVLAPSMIIVLAVAFFNGLFTC